MEHRLGFGAMTEESVMTEVPRDEAGDTESWSTGDVRVDEAVARLDDLDERDVDEHADVYDTVHGDLAAVLDDAGSAGPSGS